MADEYKNLFLLSDEVTYLNCANMSPLLKSAREAGLQALDKRASPWAIFDDWFSNSEKVRSLVAGLLQTSGENICIIPSASYGLALAAKNLQLPPGKEIIILEKQFPSNYYVWKKLAEDQNLKIVTIEKISGRNLTESILEKINNNTGLIAIPNCHWIDGSFIDLEQISQAAKKVASCLILDLSQSLGALPVNIESIDPDFAVSVGYKWLFGPYSLGYMYVTERWQEKGEPLEYSWATKKGSEEFANLTRYVKEYRKGARKFDMGEFLQLNLLPIAIAGLQQVHSWKVAYIQNETKKLTDKILAYTMNAGMPHTTGVGHITGIPFDKKDEAAIKSKLQANKVIISFRGTLIRVSPHLYNSENDIDTLLSCLA